MRRALASWALSLILVCGWALLLRPPVLGGGTSYVFVRGQSMLPTHSPGDLVMVRHRSTYTPGMVVAFKPSDEAPGVVIHRVVRVRDGRLITRGDNLDADDPWRLGQHQILGEAFFDVSRVGLLLARVADPLALGALCGAIVALFTLTGPKPTASPRPRGRSNAAYYIELDRRGAVSCLR